MKRLPLWMMTAILVVGCDSRDSRLAHMAQQSTQQQAHQNVKIAELAQSSSDNHRRSVEAIEKSRQEVARLDYHVRKQIANLDVERRALAVERHRESLVAPAIETLGVLLVAALPLMIAVYLLHGLRGQNDDEAVSEVVIRELLAGESPLLLHHAEPQDRLQRPSVPSSDEERPF